MLEDEVMHEKTTSESNPWKGYIRLIIGSIALMVAMIYAAVSVMP